MAWSVENFGQTTRHSLAHKTVATMGRDKDLFDQSFDVFRSNQQASRKAWNSPSSAFESGKRDDSDADPFARAPPLATPLTDQNHPDIVVSIHEQLSMAYESSGATSKSVVEGTIFFKHPSRLAAPFCLILRDPLDQIATLVTHRNAEDISKRIFQGPGKDAGFRRTDRIFKIGLGEPSTTSTDGDEILVARYICVPQLRPVPLVSDQRCRSLLVSSRILICHDSLTNQLIKSRVHWLKDSCRLAFKLRSNPSSDKTLAQVAVVLAIPLNFRGESAKLSMTGGVWDEVKRTVSWYIDEINPGQAVEFQIELETSLHDIATCQFPVLVRADCSSSLSQIQVLPEICDSNGRSCLARVMYSSRTLHRKL